MFICVAAHPKSVSFSVGEWQQQCRYCCCRCLGQVDEAMSASRAPLRPCLFVMVKGGCCEWLVVPVQVQASLVVGSGSKVQ
mmetsp:Transcript_12946/g.37554  ORF Transcript_12946/g.37554 Transcript_12946/m.37554 type:complete len:81 (-) Transcript_12946:47-289(-)